MNKFYTNFAQIRHLELVSDLDQLLAAGAWEGQVNLHDLVDWISL